jgi:hypothetical protein
MDTLLGSHLIAPGFLRADQFESFYQARKAALLSLVGGAMGKAVVDAGEAVPDDAADDEDDEVQNVLEEA